MNYRQMAQNALDERQALIEKRQAVESNAALSERQKRRQLEELASDIQAKTAEAEDCVRQGEREREGRELARKSTNLYRYEDTDRENRGRPPTAQLNVPLQRQQSFADLAGKRVTAEDFGTLARDLAYGREHRAVQVEPVDNLGGFLVANVYSASVLDVVRNKCRVIEAGATVVPLGSDDVRIAKVTKDPTPA